MRKLVGLVMTSVLLGALLTVSTPLTAPADATAPALVHRLSWGGPGSGDGQFNYPLGIAADGAGNVYVVDAGNNRIQKFASDGTYLTQWGGSGTGNGQFTSPAGVGVSADGVVYVTDAESHRVQRFDSSGAYLGQWGELGNAPGQFDHPYGIAVNADGQVYVADTFNSRIQRFGPTGAYLGLWGSSGDGAGQFQDPSAVAIAPTGDVYVADTTNSRVQRFSAFGTWLSQVGGPGTGDGQFGDPHGVAVDAAGRLYVTDFVNQRTQLFDAAGAYLAQRGGRGTGDGQFAFPFGVAVGPDGWAYVVDRNNHRVQALAVATPDVSIVKTADETSVVAGDPIHYHLTITNSGDVVLHGVTVTDPNAPDCDRNLGNLAPGAESTVDCGYDTTPADVGLYANTASVDTDETDTIDSNTVDVHIEPRPEITITKSADETSVFPEEPIHYHLTATNTGAVALTGVTVTDPNAPECDRPLGDLGVGGDQTIDCTYTPTADQTGTYTNTATVDTDQTDAVDSNPVDVNVERVRPDAMIARGTGRFLGDDVYGTDGTGQTKRGSVLARGSVTFTVRAENDGTATDDLVVKGSRSTDRFRVTYRVDGDDVTAAVNAGTYQFDAVPPTASRAMTVTVKARAGTPRRASFNARIRVSSPHDLTQRDAVVASVTRV